MARNALSIEAVGRRGNL